MVTINGFTITSLETIHAYDRVTGACELYLDELKSAKISNTEDTQDITGKGDRLLKQIKKNKATSVTGQSALISGGLLSAQTGSEIVSSDTTVVRKPDILTVDSTKTSVTTSFKAIGVTGNEIGKIFVLTPNGGLGKSFTQAAEASETEFAYNPETKVLTLPTAGIEAGDKIAVFYDYETTGAKLVNKSDVFGKTLKLYIDAIGSDSCDNEYKCQFVIPRAQFSGTFDVDISGNQVVQDFTANTLVDTCAASSTGDLFEFIVYQDTVA